MLKFKKFSKKEKRNNVIFLSLLCLSIAIVSLTISYAVYQKEDEVLFINARVGQFETSSSDIELAMTLDGNDIDIPPSKGYYNVTVVCDHADGSWNNDKWLAEIGNITSNRVKCNVNFETLETLASIVELGDYISITPTSTSYTIPTSLTGYSSNQTINPSELNLWRVIKKNEDGTVDVVSEYSSSIPIYLWGNVGYMNYVGALNTIASQYTNDKYVVRTRHMGYSNQIEYCLSHANCPNDTDYQSDVNLVSTATGQGGAYRKGDSSISYHWLASRHFVNNDIYSGRIIGTKGDIKTSLDSNDFHSNSLRPILTLKSDVKIATGDGSSVSTAYTFE